MTRCQPARWKKVALPHSVTNASQRVAVATSVSDKRFTTADCGVNGTPGSMA
jgi:hypothetical protein